MSGQYFPYALGENRATMVGNNAERSSDVEQIAENLSQSG